MDKWISELEWGFQRQMVLLKGYFFVGSIVEIDTPEIPFATGGCYVM